MTKEEVIAMAQKAGFMLRSESVDGESNWWECFDEEIESFARLVRNDYSNKPWVGLTDEQIHNTAGYQETREMYSFARAIEAKLKEKNT